jgi:membrane associated rhomboid family serine protease
MFTYAMLAVFLAFFAAEFTRADLSAFFAFQWRVADGEIWRLVTATFLHGSLLHIAFNAALFLRFSTVVDDWLGPWAALLLYGFFATASNAAEILIAPGLVLGASGVVYGLFGFLWVLARRRDDAAEAANASIVQTMLGWLAICFVVNQLGGHIANTAHIVGLALGWLLGQTVVARRKWRIPMALATLAAWALPIALTQRPVWNHTLAHVPVLDKRYFHDIPADVRERAESPDRRGQPGFF